MSADAAGRIFASHYQLMLCDDPKRLIPEDANWSDDACARGFAGDARTRLVGTEADLNDHWVEAIASDAPPDVNAWQRVTLIHFRSETGDLHVMSVMDDEPTVTLRIGRGDFSVYVAGQSIGQDLHSKGETVRLSDDELAQRKDLEWYRIFVVPGVPASEGRIRDV